MDDEILAEAPSTSAKCCKSKQAVSPSAVSGPPVVQSPPAQTPHLDPATDPTAYVKQVDGGFELHLIVDNLTCPGCVPKIEDALAVVPGIGTARVNLSLGRLKVTWSDPAFDPRVVGETLTRIGYRTIPYNAAVLDRLTDDQDRRLLRALAVAGFAAANIMLLSVSVWSGNVTDMGPATRTLFHWISALIALPTVVYSGQPFYRSAWSALRAGRLNMDVPISLAVLLATSASVMESVLSGRYAYFDAAVGLLFFLLIGRYLDHRMRARATSVGSNLLALKAVAATVITPDGRRTALPADQLRLGMIVAVVPGDRIPADGTVARGRSDVDASLITGESTPVAVAPGDTVYAGTLCLSGPLEITVDRADRNTLLAQIVALMENAGQAKARYTRLADRMARIYAPTVHVLAASTFVGWLIFDSGGWHPALMNAIAVLIITCPCALGLAVPMVQAVATGRLLRSGVLVKSGDALERLSEIDTVVLDKTGTLTLGRPELVNRDDLAAEDMALASCIAQGTRHPLAQALVRAVPPAGPAPDMREEPGLGLAASIDGAEVRLGNRAWCGVAIDPESDAVDSELWLKRPNAAPVQFRFRDRLRPDAAAAVNAFRARGLAVEMLSGDRIPVVTAMAKELGITEFTAAARPQHKVARLQTLAARGRKVLMIGDGLNDAPALASAYVSISPALASDISQIAADLIFRGERLGSVVEAIDTARRARARIFENFGMSLVYNVLAVPIAVAGWVTPLIAALAMSGSSIAVTLNALRLARRGPERAP
ncbi:MAG: cadmium-translocating P-type ATPase [Rhodospirillaceae bacterium]|nr:MAG: cadmium-translocating P-type ATPase [Rhodospirillaceae bacterium]